MANPRPPSPSSSRREAGINPALELHTSWKILHSRRSTRTVPHSSTKLTPVYIPHAGAALAGVLSQSPDVKSVTEVAKSIVEKLKKLLTVEQLQSTVSCTKFDAAVSFESREGIALALGKKVFSSAAHRSRVRWPRWTRWALRRYRKQPRSSPRLLLLTSLLELSRPSLMSTRLGFE
ncbi:hypothetical protein F5141DRAFT_1293616 [Pisolithus sp. B1]|nr:hypothetical protein F5141DRAFT_1293616 [Pisolithus sp. B1]